MASFPFDPKISGALKPSAPTGLTVNVMMQIQASTIKGNEVKKAGGNHVHPYI